MAFEEQQKQGSAWERTLVGDPVFSDLGRIFETNPGPSTNLLGPSLGTPHRGLAFSDLALQNVASTPADKQTDKRTDKQRLDDAVTDASIDLSGFVPEGKRGMERLTALPPHLQSEAVSRLSREEFVALLESTPEADREGLKALVDNVKNPQRKLELWGAYHKAHAKLDAQRRMGDATDPEQLRRHVARMNAADSTGGEVDDEVMSLVNGAVAGTPITLAAVEALMKRKEKEHALEMKYNVNFTNQKDGRVHSNKGSHIHWSSDELDAIDDGLSQVPEAHTRGNTSLREIRRSETDLDSKGKPRGTLADTSQDGLIRVFDNGTKLTGKSPLDTNIVHELGHTIERHEPAGYAAYLKAAGWHQSDGSELTPEEKAKLDKASKDGLAVDAPTLVKNGKRYQRSRYGDGYMVVDDDAIPQASESKPRRGDTDPWSYARTNPKDDFAEHYSMAALEGSDVYTDLVTAPRKVITEKEQEIERLVALEKSYKDIGASENDKAVLHNEIRVARLDLVRIKATADKRKAQFDVMRDKVFHTNDAQAAAEKRLAAKGLTPAQMQDFKDKAATASTPAQLKRIEARY